ncbi:MAG: hypothetical protein ACLP50_08600 [Solirubrobacteraceae bacterium]
MNRPIPGPSGEKPPSSAISPRGEELDLVAVAKLTCSAYDAEFSDERARYGPAGLQWCRHDNQHLLNWAVISLTYGISFENELAWLARILEHRQFPLQRLARDLELLSGALTTAYPDEQEVAERIKEGAAFIARHSTFIS